MTTKISGQFIDLPGLHEQSYTASRENGISTSVLEPDGVSVNVTVQQIFTLLKLLPNPDLLDKVVLTRSANHSTNLIKLFEGNTAVLLNPDWSSTLQDRFLEVWGECLRFEAFSAFQLFYQASIAAGECFPTDSGVESVVLEWKSAIRDFLNDFDSLNRYSERLPIKGNALAQAILDVTDSLTTRTPRQQNFWSISSYVRAHSAGAAELQALDCTIKLAKADGGTEANTFRLDAANKVLVRLASDKLLMGLANVSELHFSAEENADDALVDRLKLLPQLRRLSVSGRRITSSSLVNIEHFSALTDFDCSGTRIDDSAISSLARSRTIRRLNLSETRVTGFSCRELERMADRLLSLDVSNSAMEPADIFTLRELLPKTDVIE